MIPTMATREPISITTPDGTARGWVHRDGGDARAGVVLYADAFGVRPTMHDMCDRLAGLGYAVLLPDVYYRAGEVAPFDPLTAFSTPPERERLMGLMQTLTPERIAADSAAYVAALATRSDVRADRIGCTGYCMGGRLSYLTAAFNGERVRAAASFHGGGLVTDAPNSPHRLADRVTASLYFGVADNDRGCTPEQQGALAAALGAAHVSYRMELYVGKLHGFALNDHSVYDRDAAETHWKRLEALFAETLA